MQVERLTRELTARDEEQHSLDIRIGQLQNERDTACKHFEQLKVRPARRRLRGLRARPVRLAPSHDSGVAA